MKLPPRNIAVPSPADPLVIDAAELHRERVAAHLQRVYMWFGWRHRRDGEQDLYRRWTRAAVRDLRAVLATPAPESDPMIRLSDWQLDAAIVRYEAPQMESIDLVDRLHLQESICRILVDDRRLMRAQDVRDVLRDEAARRFVGLFEPKMLSLAA